MLCITISDNEGNAGIEQREKEILQNILCDQVHALGGTIHLSAAGDKNNLFIIALPLNFSDEKALKQAV